MDCIDSCATDDESLIPDGFFEQEDSPWKEMDLIYGGRTTKNELRYTDEEVVFIGKQNHLIFSSFIYTFYHILIAFLIVENYYIGCQACLQPWTNYCQGLS